MCQLLLKYMVYSGAWIDAVIILEIKIITEGAIFQSVNCMLRTWAQHTLRIEFQTDAGKQLVFTIAFWNV